MALEGALVVIERAASAPSGSLRSRGFFGELRADIEDRPIPYDVDVVDLRHAAPALIEEVHREGIPWRT